MSVHVCHLQMTLMSILKSHPTFPFRVYRLTIIHLTGLIIVFSHFHCYKNGDNNNNIIK